MKQLDLQFTCEPVTVRQPDGSLLVKPGEVRLAEEEIDAAEVCRLLRWPRSTLNHHLNYTAVGEMIDWRWSTPSQGKRVFSRSSVLALRERLQDQEFSL